MAKEENKELHEFFGQMQEGERASQGELAERAKAAREATAGIGLESEADTRARLQEIAARTEEIKQQLGKIELAVDLSNEQYVSREDRARMNQQREKEREQALNPGHIPPRAAKYHADTRLPSTAPKIEPKKGFFSGFFGRN